MAQHFVIASPSVNEVLDWSGKLGEILFDGSAKSIVRLLAVPVRPLTSAQRPWRLQGECVEHEAGSLLVDTQSTKRNRAESVNERPTGSHEKKQKLGSTVISEPGQIKADSPNFSSLETELHDLIVEELEIRDVLCLSLTSRYFFSVCRRHIQTCVMSVLGPWSGESIVCLGDYGDPEYYPPGLFTEDERSELQQREDEEHQLMDLVDYTGGYTEIDAGFWPTLLFKLLFKDWAKYYFRMSEVMETLDLRLSQFYPEDIPWILRNLTTREYVRSDAIALKPEHIHGPNIEFLGFGEVVLSRICWSSDPSVSMAYEGDIHRGVWAGHCFDITTRARHEQDVKEEWKDVSEEVAREMAGIWESEYGSDWRRIIMEKRYPDDATEESWFISYDLAVTHRKRREFYVGSPFWNALSY